MTLIAGWGVQVRLERTDPWDLPTDPALRGAPVLHSRWSAARFQAEYLRGLGWQTRIVTLTGQLTVEPAK